MHKDGRRIIVVKGETGFCSGVDRAITEVENLARKYDLVFTLDSVLHNETEMKRLEALHVKKASKTDVGDVIVLPAHGATEKEKEDLKKRFKKIVDVTCPFVLRTENIIRKLKEENYKIVIVGEKTHRETLVLSDVAGDNLLFVISEENELKDIKGLPSKVALVSQSTISKELSIKVAEFLIRNAFEFRYFDTICPETLRRQSKTKEIAEKYDCVIVVGGKNSSNTKRLYEIAKSVNKNTFFVEDKEELIRYDLTTFNSIAVVSGTSTPNYIIEDIINYIENL